MEALSMLASGPLYYAPESPLDYPDYGVAEPPVGLESTSSSIDETPQPAVEPEVTEVRTDPSANHPARRRSQRRPWIPRQLGR